MFWLMVSKPPAASLPTLMSAPPVAASFAAPRLTIRASPQPGKESSRDSA